MAGQLIGCVTLVVQDYDEAISYFSRKLGFEVVEDRDLGEGKRWVLVAPPGSHGTRLLLAKAVSASQISRIGDQTGGRVFLFLHTDNFWRDYDAFCARGVQFREEPRNEPYGTIAVFEDIYGNRWDLIQPSNS
jgi:catechol 2,3-dioxygenase-like lactoylglutathione lyase family enzyme